nr:MAG TPA: hypothetical protein [Caudoviricetes sp.]
MMEIVEFNHTTAANLMRKPVENYWLENKVAYIKFTDGSTVGIHPLFDSWEVYVSLTERDNLDKDKSVDDGQAVYVFGRKDGDSPYTSRTLAIEFDTIRYYIHYSVNKAVRTHIPIIEFHYYEEGEPLGDYDS